MEQMLTVIADAERRSTSKTRGGERRCRVGEGGGGGGKGAAAQDLLITDRIA